MPKSELTDIEAEIHGEQRAAARRQDLEVVREADVVQLAPAAREEARHGQLRREPHLRQPQGAAMGSDSLLSRR